MSFTFNPFTGAFDALDPDTQIDPSTIDHGVLQGLGDDDHDVYIKHDGTRDFTGDQKTKDLVPLVDKTEDVGSTTNRYKTVRSTLGVFVNGDGEVKEPLSSTHGGIIAGTQTGAGGTEQHYLDGGSYPATSCIGNVWAPSGSVARIQSRAGGSNLLANAVTFNSGATIIARSSGYASTCFGYAYGGGTATLEATSSASFCAGYAFARQATSNVRTSSRGRGAFMNGFGRDFAGGATITMDATADGSFCQGMADNRVDTGTSLIMNAAGPGSFVQGYCKITTTFIAPTKISTTLSGGFAQGYAKGGTIQSTSFGAFAQGYASKGDLLASAKGSSASGWANNNAITASGLGSSAVGDATTGAITASATNSFQFGVGTNATADSLQVGANTHLRADGSIFLQEKAAATADVTAWGQFWVKDDTPNKPYFTDDAGTDHDLLAGGGVGSSPLTTKGDIYTYDTADARLAVGTDTHVLTADSAQATGVKWAAATAVPAAAVYAHYQLTAQNLGGANGTVHYVDWDGTELHEDTGFTHDTVTNPSRIQVDADGRYEIKANVSITQGGSSRTTYMSGLRVNGSTANLLGRQRNYSRGSGYGDTSTGLNTEIDLTNGDYIEMSITIDDADATYTSNAIAAECEFIIRKIA